jgi:hypothetical protein
MKLTRKQLGVLGIAHIALAATLSFAIVLSGCTFAQGADEVLLVLQGTEAPLNGACAVLSIADPPAGVACGVGVTAYTAAVTLAQNAFKTWQAADATQQPGALGDFEAAMATVKTDFNQLLTLAHVTNTNRQNTIDEIMAAVQGAITEVIDLVVQVKAGGGTTAAAVMVLHEQYGGGNEPTGAPKAASTKKAKLGKVPVDHKHIAADLCKKLWVKTGDAQLDAVRAKLATEMSK